jgi:hypothetical protein
MTDNTATTLVVVKMPAEDYFTRDSGPFAATCALAAEHGGKRTGGGTDLTTGMSDVDIEVPTANLAALCAALEAAGLPYRASAPWEGV